ncbi:MAG: molybdenum cofactor guanylyltransferase [Planctomycetota bacterium]
MNAPLPAGPVRLSLPHYVLAGGRSRRFGSDKARHRIDGVPMVVRVAEAFAEHASSTTIIAREANAYADLGLPTVADDLPDAGPLAGLATALRLSNELNTSGGGGGWLLLTSCDLRRPDAATLTPLTNALEQHDAAWAAVYRRDGRFEPFPGLYHASLAGAVRDTLASPRRSFQALLGGVADRVADRVAAAAWPADGGPLDLDRRPDTA